MTHKLGYRVACTEVMKRANIKNKISSFVSNEIEFARLLLQNKSIVCGRLVLGSLICENKWDDEMEIKCGCTTPSILLRDDDDFTAKSNIMRRRTVSPERINSDESYQYIVNQVLLRSRDIIDNCKILQYVRDIHGYQISNFSHDPIMLTREEVTGESIVNNVDAITTRIVDVNIDDYNMFKFNLSRGHRTISIIHERHKEKSQHLILNTYHGGHLMNYWPYSITDLDSIVSRMPTMTAARCTLALNINETDEHSMLCKLKYLKDGFDVLSYAPLAGSFSAHQAQRINKLSEELKSVSIICPQVKSLISCCSWLTSYDPKHGNDSIYKIPCNRRMFIEAARYSLGIYDRNEICPINKYKIRYPYPEPFYEEPRTLYVTGQEVHWRPSAIRSRAGIR